MIRATTLTAAVLAISIAGCLAAGVGHRVGGKFLRASHFTSWGEVQDMMKLWAVYGSDNLCKLQKRATCLEPKI